MVAVDVDASASTEEVIAEIGFNCDVTSISTSPSASTSTFSSSSVSVSGREVSVE